MPRREWKLTPSTITLIYGTVGVLWIILFDELFARFIFNAGDLKRFEILKGCSFVLISALLLYGLMRQSLKTIAESRQSLQNAHRALESLSACRQALIRTSDELGLIREFCRVIVEVGGYIMVWVGFAEETDRKTIRPVAQWGYEQGFLDKLDITWDETERSRGPTGTAIRTGKPVVVQRILTNPDYFLWKEEAVQRGYASSISIPLDGGKPPFGALVIYAGDPDAFDADEVDLLRKLADDLAFGIRALRASAERRREEQERMLLAQVVENAAEGFAVFDAHGLVRYVNPVFEQITGYSREEVIARNFRDFWKEEWGDENYSAIMSAVNRRKTWAGRFVVGAEGGAVRDIDATLSPLVDDSNRLMHYVFVSRDVTREAQLEGQLSQAQKMEAIGTLAGGIAHDFNNILGVIITCAEMALDDAPEGSTAADDLEHVLEAGYRGRNLVKQILTFSRRSEQEWQPVEVSPIVRECLRLLRASFPANIEVRQEIGISGGKGMIFADPTQIHQVLMNLCTNSAHAMQGTGGVLTVRLSSIEPGAGAEAIPKELQPGPYLKLVVSDTGHGMDKHVMERIFDPFFSTKPRGEGTGLGLSVVHGIVKSLEGAVTVQSEPGKEAIFSIYLPRLPENRDTAESAGRGPAPGGHETILFVDDEDGLVYAGVKLLSRLGYRVVAKSSGSEALAAFRADPQLFDLVITDQSMPRMTGTELAREILAIRPDVPVILCSGFSLRSRGAVSPEEAAEIGISRLVVKPLDRIELAEIISDVLKDLKDRDGVKT